MIVAGVTTEYLDRRSAWGNVKDNSRLWNIRESEMRFVNVDAFSHEESQFVHMEHTPSRMPSTRVVLQNTQTRNTQTGTVQQNERPNVLRHCPSQIVCTLLIIIMVDLFGKKKKTDLIKTNDNINMTMCNIGPERKNSYEEKK